MVQLFSVETSRCVLPEAPDIPAYVIRPAQSRSSRYQAPRLSRSSLRELRDLQRQDSLGSRIADNLRRNHGRLDVSALLSEPEPDTMGVVRYGAVTPAVFTGMRSVEASAPRHRAVMGVASVVVMTLAGILGVSIGTQLPQVAVASPLTTVPASLLIASQNLPTKLPLIEKQSMGVALEMGVRPANLTYVTQSGDTFASVGRKFGLKPRTVRLVNLLPTGARLAVNQKLVITPIDGAYHKAVAGETVVELAARYEVPAPRISEANPGLKGELAADKTVFIPGASELRFRTPHAVKQRGFRSNEPWSKRLSSSRSLVGAFSGRVGELAWPANGQISSPFGIRGYSFHPGVDICNAVGTSIRAAKGGVVVSAGWMGAYGYAVDVDHGGGVVTRYGHCSRVLVAAGQAVESGQELAKMGSTGRSTGPHVHFEVRLQGRAVNPLAFF